MTGTRNKGGRPSIVWSPERTAEVKRLWVLGWSATKIAAHFGDISRNAVLGRLHRMGGDMVRALPAPPNGYREKREFKAAPKKPRPKPVPAPRPEPMGMTLTDLGRCQCRWPTSEEPFLFCGAVAKEGESYCPFHKELGSQKPKTTQSQLARALRRYA